MAIPEQSIVELKLITTATPDEEKPIFVHCSRPAATRGCDERWRATWQEAR